MTPVGDQKVEPNPGPSVAHDFDCTHDPCRCMASLRFVEGHGGRPIRRPDGLILVTNGEQYGWSDLVVHEWEEWR